MKIKKIMLISQYLFQNCQNVRFDGYYLHTQELEYEMFINLHLSDILMRAEQKSKSHLVSLVNTASRRSTIKLFICYQVTRLIPGLCIYCAFCDAISYRFLEFRTTFRYESRCIGTLIGVISISLESLME